MLRIWDIFVTCAEAIRPNTNKETKQRADSHHTLIAMFCELYYDLWRSSVTRREPGRVSLWRVRWPSWCLYLSFPAQGRSNRWREGRDYPPGSFFTPLRDLAWLLNRVLFTLHLTHISEDDIWNNSSCNWKISKSLFILWFQIRNFPLNSHSSVKLALT